MGAADIFFVLAGVWLVVTSLADLANTLISTNTSFNRWWPSMVVGRSAFRITRFIATRFPENSARREAPLAAFGPALLVTLLFTWVAMQIVGFGLIWWRADAIAGAESAGDAIYYSAVVFFTVGFGEIVPTAALPRIGAMFEALVGVFSVALVVGYLPTLYAAYSDRERALMTLDAGSAERITPTNLVMAWAPDADPAKIDEQFDKWEAWATGILETHSTMPLLFYFRSHHRQQNWVTALGLLSDAAMHAQLIKGSSDGSAYWFLRRSEAVFRTLTTGRDISEYEADMLVDGPDDAALEAVRSRPGAELFEQLYEQLADHGFELHPYDDVLRYAIANRVRWAAPMEYLIDELVAPRGFWSMESHTGPIAPFLTARPTSSTHGESSP